MIRKEGIDFFWTKKAQESQFGRTEASRAGWYNTTKWTKLRNYILDKEPLCRMCLKENNRITPAVMVAHIISIKGTSEEDYKLFFDAENLQPLCDSCHIKKTKRDSSKFSEANLKRGRDLMNDLES
jgi:5-methylcytosine-specific restriction endonuclease McrA